MILLGLFAGMMLAVIGLGLSRFVARPLGLISSAMENQSPNILSALENDPSEFGRLAMLVRHFFVQKADLEHEMQERARAEEAIIRNEQNLSTILNSIGDAVISTDVDGRVVRMNPTAEQLTGWALSEVTGLHISEVLNIVDTHTGEPMHIPVDEALSTGEVCHLVSDATLISRDRTQRQIADSAAPIRDDSGAISGVVLVFSDVTEQYYTQEALKEAGDRAQRYLNIAGVMLVSMARDGTITLINKKGEDLLGYSQQELLGRNWFEVCIPEYEQEQVKSTFNRLMCGDYELIEFFENAVVTRSGEKRIISWHNALLRDTTGAIIGTLSSGEDITERKQAEDALRQSEERYSVIVERSAHGILMADIETKQFMYANPSICRMLGYTEQELLQLGIEEIHPKDWAGFSKSEFESHMRGEKTMANAIPCLRKDGSIFYADITTAITKYGDREHTVGFFTDITKRRQAEEELRLAHAEIESYEPSARTSIA